MDIHKIYQSILSEIGKGHRGLVRFSPAEVDELNRQLVERKDLEKILCLIEHSSAPVPAFEKSLLDLLNSSPGPQILIYALNCARKHIVDARFQRGVRLEFDFLETLRKLLHHPEPEVVEWALRLIEGCGNQAVYFLREFDRIKPPPWKWFNAHQRAVREIIALLERRWSPSEKS